MNHSLTSLVAALLVTVTAACSGHVPDAALKHSEKNSVYYWKTVLRLDSAERTFIRRHDIGRIYLRMFDVSVDELAPPDSPDRVVPNASLRIDDRQYRMLSDSLSDIEFVPVVYITLDALKAMKDHEGLSASNIVTRVSNMCSYNGLNGVHELQLDCDWTSTTEHSFFSLCDSVRQSIDALGLPWRLSSTIRLHQLARKAPPVDRGVLMVYNTGNFNDPDAANSIIDASDVRPYIKHLADYPLHLDVAYPAYSWQLLFRKRQFIGLMSGVNVQDSAQFMRTGAGSYTARRDIPYNNRMIINGDMIRHESSDADDILAVKAMIEKRLSGRPHSVIIYHLDTDNLSKYSSDEINNILSQGR
ncbi:MAG: hypothetical protein K2J38_03910 [Muribaculaceae bacterium]|nr:hypothetical protein [Muribaculaceae bacterium]